MHMTPMKGFDNKYFPTLVIIEIKWYIGFIFSFAGTVRPQHPRRTRTSSFSESNWGAMDYTQMADIQAVQSNGAGLNV